MGGRSFLVGILRSDGDFEHALRATTIPNGNMHHRHRFQGRVVAIAVESQPQIKSEKQP